jgi:hypothetical protein
MVVMFYEPAALATAQNGYATRDGDFTGAFPNAPYGPCSTAISNLTFTRLAAAGCPLAARARTRCQQGHQFLIQ